MYLSILIAGFGGGLVRGIIGYLKYQYSYKNVGFNVPYFLVMVFLSGIIGTLVAFSIKESWITIGGIEYISPAIAFIIGYAGGDFLDNIYKVITKKIK
jgi:ABC-type thiamin/hydroxymethylpyrimidine transport system permease subunit